MKQRDRKVNVMRILHNAKEINNNALSTMLAARTIIKNATLTNQAVLLLSKLVNHNKLHARTLITVVYHL